MCLCQSHKFAMNIVIGNTGPGPRFTLLLLFVFCSFLAYLASENLEVPVNFRKDGYTSGRLFKKASIIITLIDLTEYQLVIVSGHVFGDSVHSGAAEYTT